MWSVNPNEVDREASSKAASSETIFAAGSVRASVMGLDEIGSSRSQATGTRAATTNNGLRILKTLFFDMLSLIWEWFGISFPVVFFIDLLALFKNVGTWA
jgi:hypothetical protein